MKKLITCLALAALLLPLGAALAQDPPPPPDSSQTELSGGSENLPDLPEKVSFFERWFKPAGGIGIIIGLVSMLLLTLCIFLSRLVSRKNLLPVGVVLPLRAAAEQRDVGQMYALARAAPNLFTNGLIPGLRKLNPDDPAASKPDMEGAIAEAVGREEAQVGYWINFLSLIAGIAPMLGLFGTVSGMVQAFGGISAGAMGKPELLAGYIGEALLTTFWGLAVAMPAMVAFFIYRNNLSRIIRDAESEYSAIMDSLTGTGNLFEEAEQEEAVEFDAE